MKLVTISVVLYNNSDDDILGVINSIDFEIAQLIFFDNSNSERIRALVDSSQKAKYISSNENIGFGRGHNFVFQRYCNEAKYFLVLNPDVMFRPSLLSEMLALMGIREDVGLLTPQVFYPNNSVQETCRYIPSPLDLVFRRIGYSKSVLDQDKISKLSVGDFIDVPFPLGCFYLFQASVFRSANGFDERFFMYMEDLDIARRVASLGFRVIYCPQFSIVHKYGKGSRRKLNLFLVHLKSMVLYFNKWGWIIDEKRNQINEFSRVAICSINKNL